MRLVPFPIGTLVVVVGAEECVEALRSMQHVVVGAACALIVLVVLPRRVELRELRVEFVVGRRRARRGGAVGRVERQRRRALERRTHDRQRTEDVGPDQRRPGGDWRTRVVSHHHRHGAVPEGVDEPDGVSHHVEHAEGIGIGVIGAVPARGAPVAALIRGDDVIPRGCQRHHHFAPAVGELGEAVQEQHGWPARSLVARFQHVHRQAVDVADACGSERQAESSNCRRVEDRPDRRG